MEAKWVVKETDPLATKYIIGGELGQPGTYGVAKRCQRRSDGKRFAVKIIDKIKFIYCENVDELWDDMRTEIGVLKRLNHENIIKLYDVHETLAELYLVQELCTGGELLDEITRLDHYTEKDAAGVVHQLLKGVAHMHSMKIAHCDLKPENLLFTGGGVLKIIDFGMSRKVPSSRYLRRMCGTPYYTAPEVIHGKYHTSADCWAVGVIIFLMLYGYPPFYVDPRKYGAKENEMIYRKIKKGFAPKVKKGYGRHFPEAIKTSDEAKDLITNLLRKDVAARLTAVECLDHKWFVNASDDGLSEVVRASIMGLRRSKMFKLAILDLFKAINIDAEKKDRLKKTFDDMDTNHNGVICWEEFRKSMIENGTLDEEKARKAFQAADLDSNQTISLDELLLTVAEYELKHVDERLYKMFQLLDKNKDGYLSAKEISEYLQTHLKGDPIAKSLGIWDNVDTIIQDADINKDGKISWKEFFRAVHKEFEEEEKEDLAHDDSDAELAPFGAVFDDNKESA